MRQNERDGVRRHSFADRLSRPLRVASTPNHRGRAADFRFGGHAFPVDTTRRDGLCRRICPSARRRNESCGGPSRSAAASERDAEDAKTRLKTGQLDRMRHAAGGKFLDDNVAKRFSCYVRSHAHHRMWMWTRRRALSNRGHRCRDVGRRPDDRGGGRRSRRANPEHVDRPAAIAARRARRLGPRGRSFARRPNPRFRGE